MVEITWLRHGTYQIRLTTGEVIIIDPWIDGNPSFPLNYFVKRCDVISGDPRALRSHSRRVPLSKEFSPQVVSIYETGLWLASKGVANTRSASTKAGR